jgi:hypothetical protein
MNIIICTDKHLENIAFELKKILENLNHIVNIVYSINYKNDSCYYIFTVSNLIHLLCKNSIYNIIYNLSNVIIYNTTKIHDDNNLKKFYSHLHKFIIWETNEENFKYYNNHKYKNFFYMNDINTYNVHRNLIGVNDNINLNVNYDLKLDKIYCLHLYETPYRLTDFVNQDYHPEVTIYPAIKYIPGWVGCAYSYKNLMYNAQRCGLKYITICEDDCHFKSDFNDKYKIILSFLNNDDYKLKWDIFVGCVAGLPSDTVIYNIYKFQNMTFLEINKMHSMVFNIYNNSVYDIISEWKPNKDRDTNQIDQYIKNKNLKIIISYPFEFACIDTKSTLWNDNLYNHYNKLFEESNKVIEEKIKNFTSDIIYVN